MSSIQINPANLVSITHKDLLHKGEILEQKLLQTLKNGICYVEIPPDWSELVAKAMKLANTFYTKEKYTSIKGGTLGAVGGYHDRRKNGMQLEAFFIDKPYWKEVYPKKIQSLAEKMTKLALKLIKESLKALNVPENLWNEGTGRIIDGTGQYHFVFNHYRPNIAEVEDGFTEHKDCGQIALLFTDTLGLQVNFAGTWEDVVPKKDHFILNMGKSFEQLVNNSDKSNAVFHRVIKVEAERSSFGIFIDNAKDTPLYRLSSDSKKLENISAISGEEYLKEILNSPNASIK